MGLFEKMMSFADRFQAEAWPGGDTRAKEGKAAQISPCEQELCRTLAAAAMQKTECVRYALLFSGDVQGVGFRWNNQGLAREHGLTGWAKNLDDGTVEMELQGHPATMSEHLARIHAYYSKFRNRIWLESARELTPCEDESGFDVRY